MRILAWIGGIALGLFLLGTAFLFFSGGGQGYSIAFVKGTEGSTQAGQQTAPPAPAEKSPAEVAAAEVAKIAAVSKAKCGHLKERGFDWDPDARACLKRVDGKKSTPDIEVDDPRCADKKVGEMYTVEIPLENGGVRTSYRRCRASTKG